MTAPVAVVDTLNSLLEAELNSVFRFMGEGSPHLGRATADVRKPLAEMVVAEQRRAQRLADAIEAFGVTPTPTPADRREDQFLAYLSLKFLLPKLVDEKQLQIRRYENVLRVVPMSEEAMVALLNAHLRELREELEILEKAAAQVIAAARAAS
ncbi:MAG: hypothetical protein H0U59_00810 [Gemmatimonadaceae bacterium]|nr:hypothetical protein [Gemmatimonadaceae bacterium]